MIQCNQNGFSKSSHNRSIQKFQLEVARKIRNADVERLPFGRDRKVPYHRCYTPSDWVLGPQNGHNGDESDSTG